MDSNLTHLKEVDDLVLVKNYTYPIQEMCKHIHVSNADLKIICQNICSIYSNFDDIRITLTKLESTVDILIVTECSLNLNKSIPKIQNYTAYFTTNVVV